MSSANPFLTSLSLQGFYMHRNSESFSDLGKHSLIQFVQRHRRLVHVNLSNNALDVDTLTKLCREIGIACCETLEALHVSYNDNVAEKRVRRQLLHALRIGEAAADEGDDTSVSSTGTELAKMLLEAAPQTHKEVEELFRAHKRKRAGAMWNQLASPDALADMGAENTKEEEEPQTPIDETNVRERPFEERQAFYNSVVLIFQRERTVQMTPNKRQYGRSTNLERHGFTKWKEVRECTLCKE